MQCITGCPSIRILSLLGMGEHVGMVSKAYLLPLGDIIVGPIFLDVGVSQRVRPCVSSRKWLSLSNLFGGTNAPSCAAATLKTIQDGGVCKMYYVIPCEAGL
jgi:hypothetical protein